MVTPVREFMTDEQVIIQPDKEAAFDEVTES